VAADDGASPRVIRGLVRLSVLTGVACAVVCQPANLPKPRITLDEFFDATGIDDVHISPDGNSVLIDTERPDWAGNRYLHEIWLWREGAAPGATPAGAPFQLTQSGYDHGAQWSPDGRWIAFLSDRPKEGEAEDADKEKGLPRVWVIPADGGEAFPVTGGEEGVHSFAWSADSRAIYYAARLAWTKEQENAYRKEWNDVNRFRESERGDVIHEVAVRPSRDGKPEERQVAVLQYRASQLASSPDGKMLAFAGISASERAESAEPWRLSTIDLPSGTPRVLSHSNAIYEKLQWAPDSRRILFQVISGSLDGSYRDVQPRLYSADAGSGQVTRWGVAFSGAVSGYSVTRDGGAIVAGMLGTQTRLYATSAPEGSFAALQSWEGTSSLVSAAAKADRFAFVFSSLGKPPEVYLAANREALNRARPITTFSSLFTGRALPEGKPYRWKADDGTTVEGMLLYPPGEFGGKHLRMFTLIHGGPADADGDKFGADWYDWATLAASNGWLVFRPNYRGSIGYGDRFALETSPHIVSRPGKDILAGVDALVRDGIADPDHLTVGGYSEGGYLTNWLITQTTRFKAAVTGAGAVEHVADWGNDDVSMDDAFYLGGYPWEARDNYNAEAAIWQITKVKTPTHLVVGAEDIRVPFQESYLLERALHALGVPCTLLVFPGEGHSLKNNPWYGKIKVREELKWLEKYGAN
jgi:dipeptidyl aminopeptidase/acylaminoacyl peptidase